MEGHKHDSHGAPGPSLIDAIRSRIKTVDVNKRDAVKPAGISAADIQRGKPPLNISEIPSTSFTTRDIFRSVTDKQTVELLNLEPLKKSHGEIFKLLMRVQQEAGAAQARGRTKEFGELQKVIKGIGVELDHARAQLEAVEFSIRQSD